MTSLRSVFGWSLPPGVTGNMIDQHFGGDIPLPPRCTNCGAWMKDEPTKREPWDDTIDCDGIEKVEEYEYDESTIAIIGEEFRGKTYPVGYSACGQINGGDHKPHVEVMAAGEYHYRTCKRCGHENKESVM